MLQKGRIPDPADETSAALRPHNAGPSTNTDDKGSMQVDDYDKMYYADLRKLAARRKLGGNGNRAQLLAKLRGSDQLENSSRMGSSGKQGAGQANENDEIAQKKKRWADGDPIFGGGWREIGRSYSEQTKVDRLIISSTSGSRRIQRLVHCNVDETPLVN